MDEIDLANEQVEKNERRSIEQARIEAQKKIPESEFCLWCGEGTINGARWCSRDCCSQWEKHH